MTIEEMLDNLRLNGWWTRESSLAGSAPRLRGAPGQRQATLPALGGTLVNPSCYLQDF